MDVTWLPTLAEGLEEARRTGRPILLHPCGQGIGFQDDL